MHIFSLRIYPPLVVDRFDVIEIAVYPIAYLFAVNAAAAVVFVDLTARFESEQYTVYNCQRLVLDLIV